MIFDIRLIQYLHNKIKLIEVIMFIEACRYIIDYFDKVNYNTHDKVWCSYTMFITGLIILMMKYIILQNWIKTNQFIRLPPHV